jgi:phosphate transport system permease protein
MNAWHIAIRDAKNILAQVLATLATAFGLFWLGWILWITLRNGLGSINVALFTQMTPPPGEAGGLLNAFAGSALMSGLGIAIGAPIGVLAGTYLAEYGRGACLARSSASSTTSCCRHRRSCSACSSIPWWSRAWATSRRWRVRFRWR